MQPLLPYLLGEQHPKGRRLVNSQKCFRAEDIEEVGDNRHTTFFEMLGNWSLGDYFKEEQLLWFFEFLTKEIGLEPHRLYVTVFAGDLENHIPRDDESVTIWKKLFNDAGIDAQDVHIGSEEEGSMRGMHAKERIFYYDAKKNWWSRAGGPEQMPAGEPGGPDSEVFYDFGTPHDLSFGTNCHPNCDCGRFMEIGNSVFMEYIKKADGSFSSLPQKNVDFGAGLERIAAASNDDADVFSIDVFKKLIAHLELQSGKIYAHDPLLQRSFRIIADHLRGAVFMIDGGLTPSNAEQGYLLRRLLRRAVLHADKLGVSKGTLHEIAPLVVSVYGEVYPTIQSKTNKITEVIQQEESAFRNTLEKGLREFEKLGKDAISGQDAFTLFSTYGFPFELTSELAEERNIAIDREGFEKYMEEHRAQSRVGAARKFKGGLADHSEQSIKYHTATHLLHQALKDVLGDSIQQKGSNITPERLRFDFSFDRKITDEEKKHVEDCVNKQIHAALPVTFEDIPQKEAEKRGAIGLFEEKYGDVVRVYSIGDYSLEYCGGPHVSNTNELGTFKIVKEEAVAAGVRRIKAILE
jgi:alanyl-tRNA synthetase